MSASRFICFFVCTLLLLSCSVKKFIPEGKYLLDDVDIISTTNAENAENANSLVRQKPNSKWFSLIKVPMYTYALSGTDSTKWINRKLRLLGEAPVIFNPVLAERSRLNIEKMLVNDGYLHARVDTAYVIDEKKRRLTAVYYLHERERYYISDINVAIEDKDIERILLSDTLSSSLLRPGMSFSVDNMEMERRRITGYLRDNGYYLFQKDYITFIADTAHYSNKVKLTMKIARPMHSDNSTKINHKQYRINKIYYVSGAGLRFDEASFSDCDTLSFGDHSFLYTDDMALRPRLLMNNTYIVPGGLYSQSDVERTQNAFAQFTALKYTTLRMVECPHDPYMLDCYIMYERSKRRSVSLDIEGTNTAGDLGAAASVSFTDRNLFKGSELLSLRLFGAYEAISDLYGYTGDKYWEYGAELSLRLPGGLASSFVPSKKRLLSSSTLFAVKFNSQIRPEFKRRVLSGSWSYIWSSNQESQHKLDVIDLSYIYVPWIADTFKKEYLDSISNRNSILKYNYENLLITKLGYSYTYNSSLNKDNRYDRVVHSLRTNIECSGNILYAANKILGSTRNGEGQYTFLNIAYAQYVKGDIDYTTRIKFDNRNSLVIHVGVGVAYPYGNSRILPFEKRYFAGGANGMRGWSVRTLGPGHYRNKGSSIDFINQSGDIKLDMNVEFRTHLFWKLHSAVFIDAGNIWTIRSYKEQPGGQFKIGTFYEDLAFSYGLGLRFEMDMFVFRLDAGVKAVDPAFTGKDKYPIITPRFRNMALHFAIGYPF